MDNLSDQAQSSSPEQPPRSMGRGLSLAHGIIMLLLMVITGMGVYIWMSERQEALLPVESTNQQESSPSASSPLVESDVASEEMAEELETIDPKDVAEPPSLFEVLTVVDAVPDPSSIYLAQYGNNMVVYKSTCMDVETLADLGRTVASYFPSLRTGPPTEADLPYIGFSRGVAGESDATVYTGAIDYRTLESPRRIYTDTSPDCHQSKGLGDKAIFNNDKSELYINLWEGIPEGEDAFVLINHTEIIKVSMPDLSAKKVWDSFAAPMSEDYTGIHRILDMKEKYLIVGQDECTECDIFLPPPRVTVVNSENLEYTLLGPVGEVFVNPETGIVSYQQLELVQISDPGCVPGPSSGCVGDGRSRSYEAVGEIQTAVLP